MIARQLPVEEPAPQHRFWCKSEEGGECDCHDDEVDYAEMARGECGAP